MLDANLAELYGAPTKALNQAVKRNAERFPEDFMFQLTADEKTGVVTNCDRLAQLKFSRTRPYVFTEHGALMLGNILKSARAVEVSLRVVRAFVHLRELVSTHKELSRKFDELERKARGITPPDNIRHRTLRWNAELQMWEDRPYASPNPSRLIRHKLNPDNPLGTISPPPCRGRARGRNSAVPPSQPPLRVCCWGECPLPPQGTRTSSRQPRPTPCGCNASGFLDIPCRTNSCSSGASHRIGRTTSLRSMAKKQYDATRKTLKHHDPYLPIILETCQEEQLSREYRHGTQSYGAFTYSLAATLRANRGKKINPSFVQLMDVVKERLKKLRYQQVPNLVGPKEVLKEEVPWGEQRMSSTTNGKMGKR